MKIDINNKFGELKTHLIVYLSFFTYYLGPVSYLSYFLSIIFLRVRLKRFDWIILIALVSLFLKGIFDNGILNTLILYRFHWGFFIYYLYFRNNQKFFNVKIIFWIVSILTIGEGILVNTILNAQDLPNYPQSDQAWTHFNSVFQRSYSFGGNASVTGPLIICLFSLLDFSKLKLYLTFLSIFFVGSGAGVASLITYLLFNLKRFNKLNYFIFFGLISMILVIIVNRYNLSILYHVSIKYLQSLILFKFELISKVIAELDFQQIIFGTQNVLDKGGDFSLLAFFKCNGILGLLIYGILILKNINKKNYFPITIILLFSLHYHVIFSGPGQLIFSYVLNIKENNNDKIQFAKY